MWGDIDISPCGMKPRITGDFCFMIFVGIRSHGKMVRFITMFQYHLVGIFLDFFSNRQTCTPKLQ